MQLEKQCCTLEQSKTLRELGVSGGSLFHHVLRTEPNEFWHTEALGTTPESWQKPQDENPAFTVAELGLACRDCISGTTKDNRFYATPDEYADYNLDSVIEESPLPDPLPCYVERDTQAIALADLLIWLLKTGLLTADEVNERLNKD